MIFDVSLDLAKRVRLDVLDMIHSSHASHIASAFSVVDILAVLYSYIVNVYPANFSSMLRDKVVLSKGHAGSAMYAILAELGFFDRKLLSEYYRNGGLLSGHVSHKGVPGIEVSTGSLGQGVCMACGIALADKLAGRSLANTFAVIGDGESEEGSVWEMAAFAAKQKLSNFTVIVDMNGMQAMGRSCDICDFSMFNQKWSAFGWNVIPVEDGNDHAKLYSGFQFRSRTAPNVIIAKTIKGHGVSFMENSLLWHYRDPQGEFYEKALSELHA